MEESTDKYLINRLKDGNHLNIVLLSHNAYWPEVQKLDHHFENCNVVVFGSSTSYIKIADSQKRKKMENSDLIIFYSSGFYNEKGLAELKDIASRISSKKNKRVSIGYLYCIPFEQRSDENISGKIKIVSFKNGEEVTEEAYPTPYFSTYDLAELTLAMADSYDSVKGRKLEKSCRDLFY